MTFRAGPARPERRVDLVSKIRCLIVDDSSVVRRMLTTALAQDAELEVVGYAPNGRLALTRIPELNPDVVTLDVEMPEMDGLQTLTAIRQKHPTLPVIMFSSLTERGASVSINALLAGANDYVTKPSQTGSVEGTAERIRAELIPKIKALMAKRRGPAPADKPRAAPPAAAATTAAAAAAATGRPAAAEARRPSQVDLVAIGTSTGGPNALAALLKGLPRELPVPLVIVQHMPPLFTRYLAERLTATTPLRVSEASDGAVLTPGQAWIAPGDYHLEVVPGAGAPRARLHQGPPENFCRPAVDVLFRSAAAGYGARLLALVLTGMGHDGLHGATAIQEAGGQVLVQDEATSVVWGMPGAVASAGLAQRILPLDEIAPELDRRLQHGRPSRNAIRAGG
jgi:two-component system chemotaxis response regulator CheB